MIYLILALLLGLLLGFVGGMVFTMRKFMTAIKEADICSDDRRFVNDILGIPN